jgi:hypothetical protein
MAMNLYVTVRFGKLSYKTETVKSLGRSVAWNKKLVIPIDQISENEDMLIEIEVYDENTFSDKLVGEVDINLLDERNVMLIPRYRNKN